MAAIARYVRQLLEGMGARRMPRGKKEKLFVVMQ
jgi:hypothetical protein